MPQQTTVNFTISIAGAPLVITSPPPPAGQIDVPYSHQFTASGGTAPYTWALTAGNLPPGLVLNTAGLLSGTPTVAGDYNADVTVTDSSP